MAREIFFKTREVVDVMPLRVEDVASVTGESEESILHKGLGSYLDREIREASVRINELKKRYDVENPSELGKKIEGGSIDEHPTWEELIEWENLEERVSRLKELAESTER